MSKSDRSGDSFYNDFVIVRSKNKRKNTKNTNCNNITDLIDEEPEIDKSIALRRIESAREEIESSDIYRSTLVSLQESIQTLGNPKIEEIVCFGLGHIINNGDV